MKLNVDKKVKPMLRVAINGLGRIGKLALKPLLERGVKIAWINDAVGDPEMHAHLVEFDTVHGRFNQDVQVTDNSIIINGDVVNWSSERNPADLPWADVDIVMECTGVFTDKEKAKVHLENGASRVLVSAPSKGADKTIVYGVNSDTLTADDLIVSNASCTTNCLAPVAYALNNAFGIKRGFMTTVHSYTGDQPTLDTMHKDLYRARAAVMSMIPTSTGAAAAVGLVLPELEGKLDGVAIRVPTPNVSAVDLTFETGRDVTVEEINQAIKDVAEGALKAVLEYNERKLVSMDFNHDPHSSIFASDQTKVMDGNMCRILAWYDNEWGFSNRMADTAVAMAKFL